MRKKNSIKKEVKRIKKSGDLMLNKRKNQNGIDLWKEIRLNLRPIGKAYNKFREKRRITKQKEEDRKLKETEKQRLREEEALRLQEQVERKFKKEKKIKEEKARRLKEQERQKLEEKRIKDEREERIRQEQIYRERLIKGEEERIKQLKRVNELREEERKLIEERSLKIDSRFAEEQKIKNKDVDQQILKEQKQRIKDQEQRLKEEEIRLKEEEKRLKEKEERLKEEEKMNLNEVRELDAKQKKKRLKGTVKWFSNAKGYGFIKREDEEQDIFVHFSAVKNSDLKYLKESEQLTFEVEYSDKGPSAINLEKTIENEVSRTHLKVVK